MDISEDRAAAYSVVIMGLSNNVGKYQIIRTIGEGTFAKVKLAVDRSKGQYLAIKIIDKDMVIEHNLVHQVQREIRTMKLLNHPNIVRIHEVIGTKSKICIVMEYASGGQLLDKMSYAMRLSEGEARKLFQQLIDAVDYCHGRGVSHRDLKLENLLLDSKGNLKVSDFGLSALQKHGELLSTACGSPSYVAPELIMNRGYDGAAADIWSCGVILYELLAGRLPFNDRNLMNLYRKILRAEYIFPEWFNKGQKKLISRILQPESRKRITISEIVEDEWFRRDYESPCRTDCDEKVSLDDVQEAFDSTEEKPRERKMTRNSSFINAFQLIAMSQDLDLSGLFKEEDDKQKRRLGSKNNVDETMKKIEAAADNVSLSVEKMNNSKMKIHQRKKMTRCWRSHFNLSAEVIEVAPTHCVVELSRSAGELGVYNEFCKSLTHLLKDKSLDSTQLQEPKQVAIQRKETQTPLRSEENDKKESKDQRGYWSS